MLFSSFPGMVSQVLERTIPRERCPGGLTGHVKEDSRHLGSLFTWFLWSWGESMRMDWPPCSHHFRVQKQRGKHWTFKTLPHRQVPNADNVFCMLLLVCGVSSVYQLGINGRLRAPWDAGNSDLKLPSPPQTFLTFSRCFALVATLNSVS